MKSNFGDAFKSFRLRLGLTLRDFCQANGFDPGNISKLERGVFPPPQSDDKLREYALALKLREGTADWVDFFDKAAAESGRLPRDLQENEAVLQRLPSFFRTLRKTKLSGDKLDKLIKRLEKA